VMAMMRIGKSSVYNLLQTMQLKHVRVGKKYIIPKQAVIDFLNNPWYNYTG
jgi:excisionase family DNA binding protein